MNKKSTKRKHRPNLPERTNRRDEERNIECDPKFRHATRLSGLTVQLPGATIEPRAEDTPPSGIQEDTPAEITAGSEEAGGGGGTGEITRVNGTMPSHVYNVAAVDVDCDDELEVVV